MSLLKTNEIQNYNGSSLTLTASTVSTSAQLNTGGNISVTGSLNVSDDSTTRTNLGLGTIATQDSNNVNLTGGTIGSGVDLKAAINASGSAPIYACRAWVNFRGTSQSGTLNTSGPVTGLYTATVTGATTFTIEYSSTTYTVTTSGNHEVGDGEGVDLTISGTSVTIDTQIRESGNVSSITDLGLGSYEVNFTTAMPDGNYAVTWEVDQVMPYVPNAQSSTSARVESRNNTNTNIDGSLCVVAIFR